MARRKWCKLYIVSEGTEWFKIGRSVNPRNRLIYMQSGNPRKLSLIKTFRVEYWRINAIEFRAHSFFKHCERHGEWFKTDKATAILNAAKAIGWFSYQVQDQKAHQGR